MKTYNVVRVKIDFTRDKPIIEREVIATCHDMEEAFLVATSRTTFSANTLYTVEAPKTK